MGKNQYSRYHYSNILHMLFTGTGFKNVSSLGDKRNFSFLSSKNVNKKNGLVRFQITLLLSATQW